MPLFVAYTVEFHIDKTMIYYIYYLNFKNSIYMYEVF